MNKQIMDEINNMEQKNGCGNSLIELRSDNESVISTNIH